MNKKYWLRVGLVLSVLYIVAVVLIWPDSLTWTSGNALLIGLTLISYPLAFISIALDVQSVPLLIVLGVINWFIIGAILGLVYGKIKSRNKI
jgi:hypothetical protein